MTVPTDLDQGGTFRQFERRWLGPSVGWVLSPTLNVLPITVGGLTIVPFGVTLITVNINSLVSIQLPRAQLPDVTAGVLPGRFIGYPVTIADIGGFADTATITIFPEAPETIMELASIKINVAYGAYVLFPNLVYGGWTQQ